MSTESTKLTSTKFTKVLSITTLYFASLFTEVDLSDITYTILAYDSEVVH